MPDQETITLSESQIVIRAKRDETFGLSDVVTDFATVLGISAAWVYGLSFGWGVFLGYAIASANSAGVARMNPLLLLLVLNLFIGLPGLAVYLRWQRLWPGELGHRGDWCYRIRTERMTVVFMFRSISELVVVTAWRERRRGQ